MGLERKDQKAGELCTEINTQGEKLDLESEDLGSDPTSVLSCLTLTFSHGLHHIPFISYTSNHISLRMCFRDMI